MKATTDTICAISTPAGVGGIAIIRLSGPDALTIAAQRWRGARLTEAKTHTAHLGTLLDGENQPLDQAVATVYRSPGSFTGDDVVEFSVHGSTYIQRAALESLCSAGARLAAPGEFTRRAFAAGKMDLAQAEAVADLIASQSRGAHRLAINQMRGGVSQRLTELREQLVTLGSLLELELDFSEEEVEFASRDRLIEIARAVETEVDRLEASFARGAAIKEGIPVAIVGPTNVGKSSLLNALLDDDRAIVSDIHGTTRDTIEDTAVIGDYQFRFIDTAGLRETDDTIESLGIDRSRRAMAHAAIIVQVIDSTRPETDIPLDTQVNPDATVITVANKSDLAPSKRRDAISISALNHQGIDSLRNALIEAARGDTTPDTVLITNVRHQQALIAARESIGRVIDGLQQGISGDFIAQDLRETLHHLGQITGSITTDDLLHTIFARFCIGK